MEDVAIQCETVGWHLQEWGQTGTKTERWDLLAVVVVLQDVTYGLNRL